MNVKRYDTSLIKAIRAKRSVHAIRAGRTSADAVNSRLKTGAIAGGAALLLIAGCGGHDTKAALPSSTLATPVPGAPSASPPSSRQAPGDAVVAAYKAFFEAAGKAITAPPEQARVILRDYVTGAYLDWEIRQIMIHQSEHQEPWGTAIVHVTRVDLKSKTAKVHDCQDASNAGLADARTHKLLPRTRGTADRNLIADMTREGDDRWRVAGLKQYRTACHVPGQ
jgi:hypothetical protein